MKTRRIIGLVVSCITVFVIFFSITYIEYIRGVQQFKYVDFDYKTLTAADYTVEFTITKNMWSKFLNFYLDVESPIPDIGQFRIYIKEEFEKRIRHLPAIDDLDNDESEFAPKIAMISFAYNNSEIINQLKTRGDYIKAE